MWCDYRPEAARYLRIASSKITPLTPKHPMAPSALNSALLALK